MGQKHNRRRSRPRSRHRSSKSSNQYSPVNFTSGNIHPVYIPRIVTTYPYPLPYSRSGDSSAVPLAQQWHNRYTAWQNRDHRQREEAAKLEADQCRLFGGEPGDDVALCYRMLEYFGGLDYIDT